MTLQLADHSITRPFGVVEDVLVKIHQLTFPVDFVIMEIEDVKIPLIVGRPFMLTAKCVADMDETKLVVNPVESSSVFMGPKQVKTRAIPDIPAAPPPAVPPLDISPPSTSQTFMPFSLSEKLLPMLHNLYHGQYLQMQSLHHLSLQ
ncbi:uncharacterized protein LOC114389825 [Glycine soja]|uniref:uncharacterized protein n=1 Tax=Glycine max TaxID=3847 RepID=UPI0003DE9E01|nr:uncharacterized protein LOC102661835 [Glycine max]XP_028206353.1 uncharacterized protein LOC114389825 [Glycine soja]|eukprot:XP_006599912.1 uncharacterized protein LOC102661835 [Glycine max]